MNQRQYRVIRAGESAVIFARELKNPPLRVTEAANRLEATLDDAKHADVEQLSAKQLRRAPHISMNRAKTILVRKHLDPIVADGLEMFAGLPGIKESLRLPRIKDAPAKHLEAAERVRRVAEEHEKEFIRDRNYGPDFLEKLDLAVQNLEAAARVAPGTARAQYTRATQHVKEEIARVRRALDVLDSRMAEAYLDDDPTLKNWRHASRVPGKIGRPKKRKPRVKRGGRAEAAPSPSENWATGEGMTAP
jgi:hypothetical protein